MQPRLDYVRANPEAYKALHALNAYVNDCGLEPALLELVKIRASQINRCAFCLNMHTKEARRAGEREERIYLLDAWREAPVYTDRERAALAWTEALTLIAQNGAPDEIYNEVRAQFAEAELVDLSVAIGMINVWNRIVVGFRTVPQVAAAQPG